MSPPIQQKPSRPELAQPGINEILEFRRACDDGHVARVQAMIESGFAANMPLSGGWTGLHSAAASGRPGVCKLLLAHGADVHAVDSRKRTPLEMCDVQGGPKFEVAAMLVAAGAKLPQAGNLAGRIMYYACRDGDEATCRRLLDLGVPATATNEYGMPAFHAAAGGHHFKLMALLLAHGEHVDCAKEGQDTALHTAACMNQLDVMDWLIAHGADIDLKTKTYQRTPLHAAIDNLKKDAVLRLVFAGADVSVRDSHGQPLSPSLFLAGMNEPIMACLAVTPDFDAMAAEIAEEHRSKPDREFILPGNRVEAALRCQHAGIAAMVFERMERQGLTSEVVAQVRAAVQDAGTRFEPLSEATLSVARACVARGQARLALQELDPSSAASPLHP